MSLLEHEPFQPITEVTADGRARIPIGKAGVQRNDRFLVSRSEDGTIMLTPMASIPRRELLIWENEAVRESLMRGLDEAHNGKARPRDDFLDDFDPTDDE